MICARDFAFARSAASRARASAGSMLGSGLGLAEGLALGDGEGVAWGDVVGLSVGIGAGVCHVVSPGGGVGVAVPVGGDGDAEGGTVGPSALAGEASSQAKAPTVKVAVRSPLRDNVPARLPEKPHLPVAGAAAGRPWSRAQFIEETRKFSRTS
jgi:hypothetical protein